MKDGKEIFSKEQAIMELSDDVLDQVTGGQTIPPLSDFPHLSRSTDEIRSKINIENRQPLGSPSVDDIIQEMKKQTSQQCEININRVELSTLIDSPESDFATETIGRIQPTPPTTALGGLNSDINLWVLGAK